MQIFNINKYLLSIYVESSLKSSQAKSQESSLQIFQRTQRQPITFITKCSILDVAAGLDLPLGALKYLKT